MEANQRQKKSQKTVFGMGLAKIRANLVDEGEDHMLRKSITALTLSLGLTMAVATPAHATWGSWFHKHKCGCGDSTGTAMCGSSTSGGTTSTSGGTTSTSGGTTSGGTTTTSGGSTTTTSGGTTQTGSSGGTAVPEPGMLGMMGLGLVGLAYARRRKKRA